MDIEATNMSVTAKDRINATVALRSVDERKNATNTTLLPKSASTITTNRAMEYTTTPAGPFWEVDEVEFITEVD